MLKQPSPRAPLHRQAYASLEQQIFNNERNIGDNPQSSDAYLDAQDSVAKLDFEFHGPITESTGKPTQTGSARCDGLRLSLDQRAVGSVPASRPEAADLNIHEKIA